MHGRTPRSTCPDTLVPYTALFRSRRSALACDGDGGDRVGEPGGEHGVAAEVHRLLPALRHAAGDDVVDRLRIEIVAVGDRVEDGGAQVDGVDTGKPTAAAAAGGTDGIDDIGNSHGRVPFHT